MSTIAPAPATAEEYHLPPYIGPVWCVIPARLESTRLERKLLRDDHGEPLILTTVVNAVRSGVFDHICVVTDSEEIAAKIPELGHNWMFSTVYRAGEEFNNGTERVAALFKGRPIGREPRVVIALQADEPEIAAHDFGRLAEAVAAHPAVDCATLVGPLMPEWYQNPNVVKVAVSAMSQLAIDFHRDIDHLFDGEHHGCAFHHAGIYGWKPDALRWYAGLSVSQNEEDRRLEQMRTLDNGGRIRTVYTQKLMPGIDDEQSYQAFVDRYRRQQ